jgi:hypothetical protein
MTRLTPRCMNLLRLLRSARWLTTSQIQRRFFPNATLDAVRKRLRKLTRARYVHCVQQTRISEALFTLGNAGRLVLADSGDEEGAVERRPPVQLGHFIGVNDIRMAAELAGDLSYFFAYFELPGVGWQHPIIPDAVFSTRGQTFAVEFDRGMEGVRYFVRSKIPSYRAGIDGLSVSAVLVVTQSEARLRSLAREIGLTATAFLYTTISRIREEGLVAPIFRREPDGTPIALFENSLPELSCREDRLQSGSRF